MNNDKKINESIIPPLENDSNLQSYRCPHCDKFLFKGNVKKLNMVCHHCQKMISADGNDILQLGTE